MPNKEQIKPRNAGPNPRQLRLLQTAASAGGLRKSAQYYLLLGQYRRADGRPATSCKQFTNAQIDNFLAVCESLGWRHPHRAANFYRDKDARRYSEASFAQQAAIRHFADDLGWNDYQLAGMIERMTHGQASSVASLTPKQAHAIIEALKNMFARSVGRKFKNCRDVPKDQERATDGQTENQSRQVRIAYCPFPTGGKPTKTSGGSAICSRR